MITDSAFFPGFTPKTSVSTVDINSPKIISCIENLSINRSHYHVSYLKQFECFFQELQKLFIRVLRDNLLN